MNQGWESPWGRGRPGWHIECSAMSESLLGIPFDIHGGGIDLRFPHHENECAQSICAHYGPNGKPDGLARFWLHNGFVMVDGHKMSKSLGNIRTVRSLLEEGWQGETIRLTLLSSHYRQPLDITDAALKRSKVILDRWYRSLHDEDDACNHSANIQVDQEDPIDHAVYHALLDDLNIPLAIDAMHALTSISYKQQGAEQKRAVTHLRWAANILGLLKEDPAKWFQPDRQALTDMPSHPDTLSKIAINKLVTERIFARKKKDFVEADRIREQLKKHKIIVEDRGDESSWRQI